MSKIEIGGPVVAALGAELLDLHEGAADAAQARICPDEALTVEDAAGVDGAPSLDQGDVPFEIVNAGAGERPCEEAVVLPLRDGLG